MAVGSGASAAPSPDTGAADTSPHEEAAAAQEAALADEPAIPELQDPLPRPQTLAEVLGVPAALLAAPYGMPYAVPGPELGRWTARDFGPRQDPDRGLDWDEYLDKHNLW